MCGIAGIFGFNNLSQEEKVKITQDMINSLQHFASLTRPRQWTVGTKKKQGGGSASMLMKRATMITQAIEFADHYFWIEMKYSSLCAKSLICYKFSPQ